MQEFNPNKKIEDPKAEDVLLLKKFIDGDKESYGKIYEKYFDKIRIYIKNKSSLLTNEMAEDLAQQVFINTFENFSKEDKKIDPAQFSLASWFYKVADNIYNTYYRKQKTSAKLTGEFEEDRDTMGDPIDLLFSGTEYSQEIKDLIDKNTSDRVKNVISMVREGKKYKDIAMELGTTEQAIKNLIHQYRKRLIKLIKEKYPELYKHIPNKFKKGVAEPQVFEQIVEPEKLEPEDNLNELQKIDFYLKLEKYSKIAEIYLHNLSQEEQKDFWEKYKKDMPTRVAVTNAIQELLKK